LPSAAAGKLQTISVKNTCKRSMGGREEHFRLGKKGLIELEVEKG